MELKSGLRDRMMGVNADEALSFYWLYIIGLDVTTTEEIYVF